VYVYFAPEKEDAKFLIVAVQQKDAFVIQFKFNPDRLAKFLENPEIMGISLAGNDNKKQQPGTQSSDDENKKNDTATNEDASKKEAVKKPDSH
jgi:hypothetical protein